MRNAVLIDFWSERNPIFGFLLPTLLFLLQSLNFSYTVIIRIDISNFAPHNLYYCLFLSKIHPDLSAITFLGTSKIKYVLILLRIFPRQKAIYVYFFTCLDQIWFFGWNFLHESNFSYPHLLTASPICSYQFFYNTNALTFNWN